MVVVRMRQHHSVKVKIFSLISKPSFSFSGECVNDECKGVCESNFAVEAEIKNNETMPNFNLKSTRNQSNVYLQKSSFL